MIRYIKIANSKKRDAEVTFTSLNAKAEIKLVLPNGNEVENIKVLKSTVQTEEEHLIKGKNSDKLADLLVSSDEDIDMEMCGRFIEEAQRIYVNEQNKPVFKISKTEKIYSPTAELKEERKPKYLERNIADDFPLKWTGKYMPIKECYTKFVLEKKYQIKHINGLTYDFLYEMAKDLSDKESLMMLGAGPSGKEPLVLNDGGRPYRAFLEGRIKGDKYCLILHLSDQELKTPN